MEFKDIERISVSKGGKIVEGIVSVKELLKMKPFPRPRSPWSEEESHDRFKKSESDGHYQLLCKCQECSLEFTLLTLRTPLEIIEAYEPSHGMYGGFARKITCPECAARPCVIILGIRHQNGTIFSYAGQFQRQLMQEPSDG